MNPLYSRILSSWPTVKQAAQTLGAQAFMTPSAPGTLPKGQSGVPGIKGVDAGKAIQPRTTNDTTLGTTSAPPLRKMGAAKQVPRTVTPKLQIPRKTVPNAQRPLSGMRTPRV
jgi:hypothetical protein